jgi:lactate permease
MVLASSYTQMFDPVSHSFGLSSLVAVLPLATLFILLGVLKVKAYLASLAALLVALVTAVVVYGMGLDQAVLAGSEGAVFGFFPIMWIVINAIWIYNLTVFSGHFDVLRRSFAGVSADQRIQAIIIAFCFGSLLEALAGFGAPVAICAVMLVALGMSPLLAASLALIADTAPVAFGAIAVPITTLGTVTGLSTDKLGAMVGRQTPILALFVPFVLAGVVGGRRGVREVWPAALTAGVVFAVFQYLTSNYVSIPLTDIVASLASAAAVVVLLRFWQPAQVMLAGAGQPGAGPGSAGQGGARAHMPRVAGGAVDDPGPAMATRSGRDVRDEPAQIARAYAPYAIIIVLFAVEQLPSIKDALAKTVTKFSWPGLHVLTAVHKPVASATFVFNWAPAAGTTLLVAGLLTMLVLKVSPVRALRAYGATVRQLGFAILTVMAVLALAYVMNASGETTTLGKWMAGAGGLFALLSPILGWFGVAVTGSDTSSNSLFGALQVAAAKGAHLDPILMAAGNSSGGVIGKMISPQNLAIGAAAVGMGGREGELFRRVLPWSVVFLLGSCLLVYLQSTSALSWMVVTH